MLTSRCIECVHSVYFSNTKKFSALYNICADTENALWKKL